MSTGNLTGRISSSFAGLPTMMNSEEQRISTMPTTSPFTGSGISGSFDKFITQSINVF
jgi:hypothetical protein